MTKSSNSIVQQLQIVFSFSILLLIFSLLASYYSTQKLINNSELVNHTNKVLIEAESIISHMKDAETGQRGFLITNDASFLQPYNGAYESTTTSYNNLAEMTIDNPIQQKNLREVKALYEAKFGQMQLIIDMAKKTPDFAADSEARNKEMVKGKKVMDDLRLAVNRIKVEENTILENRLQEQLVYINFTPIILVIAALISILITVFAYMRIRNDMGKRIAQQQLEAQKYAETGQRINHIEQVTRQVSDGNYAARSEDDNEDELGRISFALNSMTSSLQKTFDDLNNKNWLQTGAVSISDAIRGERILKKLATNLINTITDYAGAQLGTIYILNNDWNYRLTSSYAADDAPEFVQAGKGLAGQVVENKKPLIVHEVPDNYVIVRSFLVCTWRAAVGVLPLILA
jgi:CHASE3 domain sensor protein/HAMP domain-containing protein